MESFTYTEVVSSGMIEEIVENNQLSAKNDKVSHTRVYSEWNSNLEGEMSCDLICKCI